MPDPRFFEDLGPALLAELASLSGARLADPADDSRLISHAAPLERAGPGSITFLSDAKRLADLADLKGAACFLRPEHAAQAQARAQAGCLLLLTDHPQAAWAAAAGRLHAPRRHDGAHPVHPDSALEEGVTLSPGVIVGQGARIGRGTYLAPGVVIGPGVTVGRDCRVGANAVVGFALIGDQVSIHAGAVIGEAGFGAAGGPKGVVDLPQLGRVILQDGVTIGAGAQIGASASVFKDVPAGETWTGFPARPLKRWLRETAWLSRKAGGRGTKGLE